MYEQQKNPVVKGAVSPPIQRRLLGSARARINIGHSGKVWGANNGIWNNGPVYEPNAAIGQVGSKEAALTAIADLGAAVGQEANNALTGDGWAQNKSEERGGSYLSPFLLRARAAWSGNDNDQVQLDYHFGSFNHGYVVRTQIGTGLTADIIKDQPYKNTTNLQRELSEYSNIHATDDANENILGLVTPQSGDAYVDQNEKKLDAVTKIAGEGARWQCVRSAAGKLKNNLRFYTPKLTGDKNPSIEFSDLWLTWSTVFNKEFNIPDEGVATELASRGATWPKINGNVNIYHKENILTTDAVDYQVVYRAGDQATQNGIKTNLNKNIGDLVVETGENHPQLPNRYDLVAQNDLLSDDKKILENRKKGLEDDIKLSRKNLVDLKQEVGGGEIQLNNFTNLKEELGSLNENSKKYEIQKSILEKGIQKSEVNIADLSDRFKGGQKIVGVTTIKGNNLSEKLKRTEEIEKVLRKKLGRKVGENSKTTDDVSNVGDVDTHTLKSSSSL